MLDAARYIVQKPSLTILPIAKIQSSDMRLHQGISELEKSTKKKHHRYDSTHLFQDETTASHEK
jgi:hypothetical protein